MNNYDFEIDNDLESIQRFSKDHNLNPSDYIVGSESTGRYHLIIQNFFVQNGFEFRLINPILTNKRITLSIRNKKTDISDAQIISELISRGEGKIISKKDLDQSKRSILRTRSTIVKHQSAIKRLRKELEKEPDNDLLDSTISELQILIDSMSECVDSIEDIANSDLSNSKTEDLIKSIPGFATKLSSIVASEVGDFSRFPSATQFKAYVGIDPKVKQSGNVLTTQKITKRGNPHLRSAFYLAAQVARCHDPELKEFYEKKKAEGKATRVAIVAVSRKLCERVYAVVTRGTPYVKSNPM